MGTIRCCLGLVPSVKIRCTTENGHSIPKEWACTMNDGDFMHQYGKNTDGIWTSHHSWCKSIEVARNTNVCGDGPKRTVAQINQRKKVNIHQQSILFQHSIFTEIAIFPWTQTQAKFSEWFGRKWLTERTSAEGLRSEVSDSVSKHYGIVSLNFELGYVPDFVAASLLKNFPSAIGGAESCQSRKAGGENGDLG